MSENKEVDAKFSEGLMLSNRPESTISARFRHKLELGISDLRQLENFTLPQGKELNYMMLDYHGITNTSVFILDPETKEKRYVLKSFAPDSTNQLACEREALSYKLLSKSDLFTSEAKGANIKLPEEISVNTEEKYRIVRFIPNVSLYQVSTDQYLDIFLDYVQILNSIQPTPENFELFSLYAKDASRTPYGIYLKYLSGIQTVYNYINSGRKYDNKSKKPVLRKEIAYDLFSKYNFESRLADYEGRVISSIDLPVLHKETSTNDLRFNPRDISPSNTLISRGKNKNITGLYPIDFEQAGWDSRHMAISLWVYHPDVIENIKIEDRKKMVRNYGEIAKSNREDISELNARIKLSGLARVSTYLKGLLREKGTYQNMIRHGFDPWFTVHSKYLKAVIFDPVSEILDQDPNEFAI